MGVGQKQTTINAFFKKEKVEDVINHIPTPKKTSTIDLTIDSEVNKDRKFEVGLLGRTFLEILRRQHYKDAHH